MLPASKLKSGVLACQRSASCNLTRLNELDFAEQIGMVMRIVASKFRMLKDDAPLLREQLSHVACFYLYIIFKRRGFELTFIVYL